LEWIRIFLINDLLDDIKNNRTLLTTYKGMGLERLSLLNIPIKPGDVEVLNLGVMFDAYSGNDRLAETIFFTVNLVFGDGESYQYKGYHHDSSVKYL